MSDTRDALLNSAENAARKYGYDGFSYADLAADVGIRKASIHHHFPTKAALSLALINRYSDRVFNALAEIDGERGKASLKLRRYIDIYRGALGDADQLCLCVAFSAGRESLSDEVIAALESFRMESIDWLKAVFVAGKADGSIAGVMVPRSEANACLAQVEGAQLLARSARKIELFDEALAVLFARLET